jgi:hypothetical protein
MVLMSTVCEPLIIHLMEGPFMGPFLVQAVVASHGVEAVEDVLVAGEGSVVVGDNAWGPHGGTLSAFPLKRKGGVILRFFTRLAHSE